MVKLLVLMNFFGYIARLYAAYFGYSEDLQNTWSQHSKSCGGQHQSPVHIDSRTAVPLAIPALEIIGFHNLLPRPISITNNGHSVEIKPLSLGYASIFGALLNGVYEVEGIHFHWGKKNNRGSEHIINDIKFAMEMHIVSRNKNYSTIQEALTHDDGLAVLAFFFNVVEEDNPALKPIIQDMTLVQPEGSEAYLTNSFTLASLMPRNMDLFYTYRGSLTTPPCSEVVTWIVFPEPMPVSISQMAKFRHLSNRNGYISDNFRRIQLRGHRKIFVRRFATVATSYKNNYRNISSPQFWGILLQSL